MSMFPQSDSRRVELEYGTTDRTMFNFFNAVYAWMAVGLAVTAVVGYFASQSMALRPLYHNGLLVIASSLGLFAIAMATQSIALRVSAAAGTAMFLLYSALMGIFIGYIFLRYRLDTMVSSFFITGGVFAVMSVFGYVTKKDLTTIGSYCIMGLMGLFIASLVNVFMHSTPLGWIVTYGVVLVTIGIIAYQTQRLRILASRFEGNRDMLARISIVGALVLYISFINLFLSVLRITGNRR